MTSHDAFPATPNQDVFTQRSGSDDPLLRKAVEAEPIDSNQRVFTRAEERWMESYREAHAIDIATMLHEDWRKTRLQEDGSYERRPKTTTDQDWITAYGTDEVDIANTTFKELPADWQAENLAAARVIYNLVEYPDTRNLVASFPTTGSEVGSHVHDEWLDRNQWAAGGELGVKFDELPREEQQKDLAQVAIGQDHFGLKVQR